MSEIGGYFQDYGIVTALPTAADHGSLCTLVDSLAAPGWRWRLQYNSAETAVAGAVPLKWEFIGGTSLFFEVTGNGTRNSTTYGSLTGGTTTDTQVTLPYAGDYDIWFGCNMQQETTALLESLAAIKLGAAATSDADRVDRVGNWNWNSNSVARSMRRTGLAASAVLKMEFRSNSGQHDFSYKWIAVKPVRIGQ